MQFDRGLLTTNSDQKASQSENYIGHFFTHLLFKFDGLQVVLKIEVE